MPTDAPELLPFTTDVLIIGAGPVGLTTANALRHHGVACRLLEEKTELSKYSKANNLIARTQELLDSIGLREPLAHNAYATNRTNVFIDGHPLDELKNDHLESPFPTILFSGQDVLEKTLHEQLVARGGTIEFGRKAMTIEPDATGVTVLVTAAGPADAPAGKFERIRCRYVVGVDGTAGTVRKALGLDFEPQRMPDRASRQLDAKLHWERSTEPTQNWFFNFHNGFAGIIPVWGGYHRLFVVEPEQDMPDREPTLEEMQQRAREITGDTTLAFTDPIWFSHYTFKHGVASSYAKDRVYLAGDAGHYNLPIGGQGMNPGIYDAVSLAWRLAMTLQGPTAPAVLDSYSPERHTVHIALDEQQVSGFKHLLYHNRVEDTLLRTLGQAVPNIGALLFGKGDLQQLSIRYPDSPLSADHFRLRQLLPGKGPVAGDRAPDAHVTTPEGETVTLFSYLYNPDGQSWGWSLLAFDGRQADALASLLAALAAVASWAWVHPRLVLAAPRSPEAEASATLRLADRDGHAHAAYGLEGQLALVLVRPDGHLAFRGPADQPELLIQYCTAVFGSA